MRWGFHSMPLKGKYLSVCQLAPTSPHGAAGGDNHQTVSYVTAQQHVGADGNISKRDDIRYSLIRSLSLLQGLYFYTTLNTILYLCISVQRVCTNPKVPQHKLGNVSSDE